VAVSAAYYPAWRGAPVWDDDGHITKPELQSVDGLRRIWLEPGATQQYYPVLHSAFWFEHRVWKDAPVGYHLTNIVLHSIAAFLIFLLLRELGVLGAMLAAFVFAVHPVHVESVAWISEQKNTLSAVLCLLSAIAYVRFDESRDRRVYLAALAWFVLALLAKTVTAMMPAVLAIVAWWRRGRVDVRRNIVPLIPFAAAAAAAGVWSAWIEHSVIGAQGIEFQLTLAQRCLIAARAIVFYLAKLVWPAQLTFNYPKWTMDPEVWWQTLFPLALIGCITALWTIRVRSRAPLAALLAFCALVFPALGFLNVYPFRYAFVADHFQYLASVPIIAFLCAGLTLGLSGQPLMLTRVAASVLLVSLGTLTWMQSRNYADAETLYRSILRRNPDSWFAHNNLGSMLLQQGHYEAARPHLEAALRLNPSVWEPYANLGLLRLRAGPIDEAPYFFTEALRRNPTFAEAHNNFGHVLFRQRKLIEAAEQFREAIRLKPLLAEPHNNLGMVLLRQGANADALREFQEASRLNAELTEVQGNLCQALFALGRFDEGAAACDAALRRQPDSPDVRYAIAVAHFRRGRVDEAIGQLRESVRIRPDFAQARNDLAIALLTKGQVSEALVQLQETVRLQPDNTDALFNLANTLQQIGRPAEAVPHYERALASRPDDFAIRTNLGTALLAINRVAESLVQFQAALRLKPDSLQARENLARAQARRGR
jgi:Tfp pilus assembly protein PilF